MMQYYFYSILDKIHSQIDLNGQTIAEYITKNINSHEFTIIQYKQFYKIFDRSGKILLSIIYPKQGGIQ